ncbi:MAG: hypothetical protein BWX74_00119 [Tenericutes bacterium ADurb.Bin087]|nr:MAG: hypothetical protein BWX74_00119 [Tenericutes bacterium ADurb.Bin087]
MGKRKKKTFKKLGTTLLTILTVLLVVMYVPRTARIGYKNDRYANILKDANIAADTRVVDIAMLGAHDAFSSKINLLSAPDPAESGIVKNKTVNAVFKGGLVRVLKAQQDGAKVLLNRGVRYFDVRISYFDGEWYTKHGLLDTNLFYYLKDIYDFLKDRPQEFVILDIQHIYTGESNINEFLNYLLDIQFVGNPLTLQDFIHHTSAITLNDLLYFDVLGPNHGGIILLLNDDGTAEASQKTLFYNRNDAIRSKWHNKRYVKDIVPLINAEADYLKTQESLDYFRVNQAQLTPDYLKDPLGTLGRWSLINIAATSNAKLVSNAHFAEWLGVMPIFMVDFANSRYARFNVRANEKIIEYNRNLGT